MSRILLIGDSNVYRNVNSEVLATKTSRPVTLIQATRSTSLDIGLREVTKNQFDVVLILALANILSDAGVNVANEKLPSTLEQATIGCIKTIGEKASKAKDVLLLPPFARTSPKWYMDHLLLVKSVLLREVEKHANMTVLPDFPMTLEDLLGDEVHLSPSAGTRLFDHITACILDVQGVSTSSTTGQPIINQLESMLRTSSQPTNSDILDVLTKTVVPQLQEISGVRDKASAFFFFFF